MYKHKQTGHGHTSTYTHSHTCNRSFRPKCHRCCGSCSISTVCCSFLFHLLFWLLANATQSHLKHEECAGQTRNRNVHTKVGRHRHVTVRLAIPCAQALQGNLVFKKNETRYGCPSYDPSPWRIFTFCRYRVIRQCSIALLVWPGTRASHPLILVAFQHVFT